MKSGLLKKGIIIISCLFLLVALFWFVVLDLVVKMVIESEGSKAVGAKVELAKADLSLFPAGIELSRLDITNPDEPMTNALSVRRLYSDIELLPLIRRKVIINNLNVEGIQLNTPRRTSGALQRSGAAEKDNQSAPPPWLTQMCEGQGALQLSIPKVDDILSAEKLESLQLAQDLNAKITGARTQWQQRLKELPTEKDLEAYNKRLNKLKASGGLTALLGSAAEIQALQSDLKKDLDRLKAAQEGFKGETADLEKQYRKLAQAPAAEVRRLKSKYALSPEGAANLSRTLFGPRVCDWWQNGYRWYYKLMPYMGGLEDGKAASEKSEPAAKSPPAEDGLPDFLIRQVHIDALLDAGTFTGQATDITTAPQLIGKPMTFKFLGRELKQIKSINMNGIINFLRPGNPHHSVKLAVQQYALQNLDLSGAQSLPLSIAQALANVDMNLNLSGGKLDAVIKAQLDSVKMALEKKVTSELNAAMAEAVAGVTRFGLTAMVEGTNPDYITKIESDLDKVLQNAVGRIIKDQGQKLESRLRAAVAAKTKGPIDNVQTQLGGLEALSTEFTQRLNVGNDLLKNIKLPF